MCIRDSFHVVLELPAGEVAFERAEIADPPAVVTDPRRLAERPVELSTRDLLAERDRLEHRAVALTPAADVVDGRRARLGVEDGESVHEVGAVDVVAHLLAVVAADDVGIAGHRAAHPVSYTHLRAHET